METGQINVLLLVEAMKLLQPYKLKGDMLQVSNSMTQLFGLQVHFSITVNYLNHHFIEITGGLTDSEGIFDETLATTEFVTINGESTFGPELPLGLWGHCIAALDENSFIVAGGVSGYTIATSYIYNKLTNEWISGPQMSTDRYLFKCGSFKSEAHGGHNVVVAVGGYSTQTGMLDTAEVFDPSNPEAGWVQSMLSLIFVAIFFN